MILGEMRLKPMTISTKRLQIRWGVVVVVAVNMINVQLAMPLWYKTTPYALRILRMPLMLIATT